MIGVHIGPATDAVVAEMDQLMLDFDTKAAKGEGPWICSDCCASFSGGMPNTCCCGHESCTTWLADFKQQVNK
jgi:hypothetical protein